MFFDTFSLLCEQKGISTYKACTEMGLNRSAVAKWKKGGTPNGATIFKMADYFGVTTDFLLSADAETDEKKEKAPARKKPVSDAEIKFALFGDAPVDDADLEDVKRFAAFIAQKKKGGTP